MSLQSRGIGCREGESGQNELLREPLALVGMHSSTRLVKNLVKYWRIPMFPAQLILPSSPGTGSTGLKTPGQVFAPDISRPAADCLHRQVVRDTCRCHYVFPIKINIPLIRRKKQAKSSNIKSFNIKSSSIQSSSIKSVKRHCETIGILPFPIHLPSNLSPNFRCK